MTDLAVNPLHPIFAAEIVGLDIRTPLSQDDIATVENAMNQYAVVAVRGQNASNADHIRFTRAFGGLELPRKGGVLKDAATRVARVPPEMFDVSNIDHNGNILPADAPFRQFSKANALWHTDSSFNALPVKWSLLMAHIIPPEGGDTEFADLRHAYDQLPEARKREIEHLTVVHDLWHSRTRAGYASDDNERNRMKPALKPLVRTAANGRKTLYMGAHAHAIIGWLEDEARPLLTELVEFATRPEWIYRHRWQPGDLVIWDNRCTLHRGVPFDSLRHRRDMRRTTNLECPDDRDASMAETAAVSLDGAPAAMARSH